MGAQVTAGAVLQCSYGSAPSNLVSARARTVLAAGSSAASIADTQSLANVGSFGLCSSLANPQVAAATAAALGVLTPMPCVPAISAPWTPGSPTVLIDGQPALDEASRCVCAHGGVVSVVAAGQATVMLP